MFRCVSLIFEWTHCFSAIYYARHVKTGADDFGTHIYSHSSEIYLLSYLPQNYEDWNFSQEKQNSVRSANLTQSANLT